MCSFQYSLKLALLKQLIQCSEFTWCFILESFIILYSTKNESSTITYIQTVCATREYQESRIISKQSKQIFNKFCKGLERYCLYGLNKGITCSNKTLSAWLFCSIVIPLQSWIIFMNIFDMACFLSIAEANPIEDICIYITYGAHFGKAGHSCKVNKKCHILVN